MRKPTSRAALENLWVQLSQTMTIGVVLRRPTAPVIRCSCRLGGN
jgi:hypothetical protein